MNEKLDNVFRFPAPYWYLVNQQNRDKGDSLKKMVVFFGNDMSGVLDFGISSKEDYVSRMDGCLDYLRRNFSDFDLCYKSHPGDEKEQDYLDLKGFRVIDGRTTAEIFMSENLEKIRAVFTIGSFSAFNGYGMGLDSHVFYPCFSDIYHRDFVVSLDQSFFEMPNSFFIRSLDQEPVDNSRELKNDDSFGLMLQNVLDVNTGKVWLICSFSEYTVLLGILSRMIKSFSPDRQVGFIASHHRRWDAIREYLNINFDQVIFMPRIHYSLKPSRIWEAVRVAQKIKNFKIASGDILLVASQPDFIESCFVSYHKNNFKIGLANLRDFNAQYDPKSSTYTAHNEFRFNKATWFFNKIFEPLLGLHRCFYLSFTSMKGWYFNRYQKPLNEIFDQLILFHTP